MASFRIQSSFPFFVDDINQSRKTILENGGKENGELITKEIEGVGIITFQYLTDIEGNIIEIQTWKGQPANWKNTRWTGILEKRDGQWVIVQQHFFFASKE